MAKSRWLLLVKQVHDDVMKEGKFSGDKAMIEALKRSKEIFRKGKAKTYGLKK